MGVKVVTKDSFIYKLSYKLLMLCRKPELYFLLVNKRSLFVLLGGSLFAENKGELAEQQQFVNLDYATTKAEKAFVIGSNFGPYTHEKYKNNMKYYSVKWKMFHLEIRCLLICLIKHLKM